MVALCHRVTYIQCRGYTRTTPLAIMRHKDKWITICSTKITAAIYAIICEAGPTIGFTPQCVSTLSLQVGGGGDMALLLARVDPDTIWIVGRWRSDTMLCYLHTMLIFLQTALPSICFNTATTYLNHQCMPLSSTKRHRHIPAHLSIRGFWGDVTVSVWNRQFKNHLYTHS